MPAGSQCEKRTLTLRVKAPLGGTNRSWSMWQRPDACFLARRNSAVARIHTAIHAPASARGADHESPDAAVDCAGAESARHGFGRQFRRLLQAGCIARLDFIAHRRALAVRNRRIAGRGRLASMVHGIDRDIGKSRGLEFRADAFDIVVALSLI